MMTIVKTLPFSPAQAVITMKKAIGNNWVIEQTLRFCKTTPRPECWVDGQLHIYTDRKRLISSLGYLQPSPSRRGELNSS